MFTGIVDAVGRIDALHGNNGVELRVKASYKGVKKGESVAVNGACLTVERVVKGGFTVHVVETTLGRTLIKEWEQGRAVNLERALRPIDRLGGHFVQGHVDGVGTVQRVAANGDSLLIDVRIPPEVAETTVLHGSVTVDGVSMTVNAMPAGGVIQLSVVPFTRRHTTLGTLAVGDRVHLEADVLGKYVRQLCRLER